MQNQQPYRGHGEQSQDLNTTWDSSGDEKEKHRYEKVASMRGPSTIQRNMIQDVRKTIGPDRYQHIRPHGDRKQDGHLENPDLTPRYRANEESLGENTYFHPQTRTTAYENHVDFAGNETRRVRPREYAFGERRDNGIRMNSEFSEQEKTKN